MLLKTTIVFFLDSPCIAFYRGSLYYMKMNTKEIGYFRSVFPTFIVGTWLAILAIIISIQGFFESVFFSTLILTSAIPALSALFYFLLLANHSKYKNAGRIKHLFIPTGPNPIYFMYDVTVNLYVFSWLYNFFVICGGIINLATGSELGLNRQIIVGGFFVLMLVDTLVRIRNDRSR